MERVHTSFLCHAEASPRVAAGAQVLLHHFADADILDLNLVAELHGRFGRRAAMLFLRKRSVSAVLTACRRCYGDF